MRLGVKYQVTLQMRYSTLALADKNSQISKKRGRSIANCGPFVAAYNFCTLGNNFDGVLFLLVYPSQQVFHPCLFCDAAVSAFQPLLLSHWKCRHLSGVKTENYLHPQKKIRKKKKKKRRSLKKKKKKKKM